MRAKIVGLEEAVRSAQLLLARLLLGLVSVGIAGFLLWQQNAVLAAFSLFDSGLTGGTASIALAILVTVELLGGIAVLLGWPFRVACYLLFWWTIPLYIVAPLSWTTAMLLMAAAWRISACLSLIVCGPGTWALRHRH